MNVLMHNLYARWFQRDCEHKNIKKINGGTTFNELHDINKRLKSKLFDLVMVSTDSKKLFNCAVKYGATGWFLKTKKISNRRLCKIMPSNETCIWLKSEKFTKKKFDIIFNLHVTAPLRNIG
jgi:CMP-N-acetylneuraminic acid synthetase